MMRLMFKKLSNNFTMEFTIKIDIRVITIQFLIFIFISY